MSEEVKATAEELLEKLRKANAEAKDWREKYEASESLVETNKGWKERAVRAEARAALREQGVKSPDRVLKLVDMDGIELDDDGKLTGLDEKVKTVKADWPELFDTKAGLKGGADIFAQGEQPKPLTGTEAQVKRLFSNA